MDQESNIENASLPSPQKVSIFMHQESNIENASLPSPQKVSIFMHQESNIENASLPSPQNVALGQSQIRIQRLFTTTNVRIIIGYSIDVSTNYVTRPY
jgi:hypothetical protein